MIWAALLAGGACWLLVVPTAAARSQRLWADGPAGAARRPGPDVVAAALTPVAGLLLVGWPWGVVAGLAGVPFVRHAVRRMESAGDRRRAEQMRRQLPAALDLIAAALTGGRPPASALTAVAHAVDEPIAAELATVADRLVVSGDMRSALVDAPDSLGILARALIRAEESGAPVAMVVATAADDVRRDARADRREAARRVAVRTAAPLGLCFLPAFFLVGIVPTVLAIAGTLQF